MNKKTYIEPQVCVLFYDKILMEGASDPTTATLQSRNGRGRVTSKEDLFFDDEDGGGNFSLWED